MRIVVLRGILSLACLLTAKSVQAEDRHFVLIFGSQSQPKRLRNTHTWATFVRAVGEGEDPSNWTIYHHTISWLPRSLDVRVWNPFPEPGMNLDLYQTLDFVATKEERVTLWGPFLFPADVYERSLEIYRLAESGIPRYRAISTRANMLVSDCIHAVAAVDPIFGRNHYPLIRIGNPASRYMAREIMYRSTAYRGVDQAQYDNSWLITRLGLDRSSITVVPPQCIPARRCLFCLQPE